MAEFKTLPLFQFAYSQEVVLTVPPHGSGIGVPLELLESFTEFIKEHGQYFVDTNTEFTTKGWTYVKVWGCPLKDERSN